MMPDKEKVVNCLTEIEQIMIVRQEICPREELQYWIELQEGVADAIALLKEQESVVRCTDCTHYKWLIESCDHVGGSVAPDWFCADGERKEGR